LYRAAFLGAPRWLWDTATWQSRVLLHDGNVTGVAFSADSKSIFTTSLDGKLRIFATQTGEQTEVVNEHVGELTALAYASNGSLAAAAPTSNLVLWRSPDDRNPHFFRNLVGARSLVFSPDARLLAVSGVGARLWICTLQTASCRECPGTGGATRSLRFAPDSRSLVTGGSDSNVYIWDVTTTERRVLRGHKATIFDLDVSPDGQWVASAGGDASLRLWPLIPVPTAAMLRPALDAATTESVEPLRAPNANAPSTAP
jgi:WD40 repeat protein